MASVNLYEFVKNPFTKEAKFNFKDYYETVYKGILFMDNIIDCEINILLDIISKTDDPFAKQLWSNVYKIAKKGRRIGLGFTALGDCIASMGLNF